MEVEDQDSKEAKKPTVINFDTSLPTSHTVRSSAAGLTDAYGDLQVQVLSGGTGRNLASTAHTRAGWDVGCGHGDALLGTCQQFHPRPAVTR